MSAEQIGDDEWAQIEAKELRLWIGEPEVGLWCPICALPSAWRAPIRRDPNEAPETWASGCLNEEHPMADEEKR